MAREAARETPWLLPAMGALAGILLAVMVRNIGRSPDPAAWAITVDRARDTLMGALAIVFTGLSIVLALTAVTAQNVAARFSLRLLRVQQRGLRDKFVIAVFAMTTTFIIFEQLRLRSLPSDALAPQGGMFLSVVLILLSGATIIWYIGATMKSLRLDRTLQRVADLIRHTVRNLGHGHKRDSPAPATALQAPPDAIPVPAPASGYVVNIDTDRVHRLALRYDVAFGFDVLIGTPIILGQDVGWVATRNDGSPPPPAAVADTIDIAPSRDPSYDVAYGIRILVDMAIMALSPAVNDPYTAVEAVNELTLILVAIADLQPGPRGRTGPDGRFDVAVAGRTLSDYLDLAADQILLYGHTDPGVIAALSRLARTVEQAAPSEPDRRHARNLADRIAAATPDTPTTRA